MKKPLVLGPSFETKIQSYLAIIWRVANRASLELLRQYFNSPLLHIVKMEAF